MAYLSKNIAFSWNKTQLLIAETYGYQKWYLDALLLTSQGCPLRGQRRGGGGSLLFLEMKASKQWRVSEGPQMPGPCPRLWFVAEAFASESLVLKCQRWVEIQGISARGRWADKPMVCKPMAGSLSCKSWLRGCRAHALAVRRLGSESQNKKRT